MFVWKDKYKQKGAGDGPFKNLSEIVYYLLLLIIYFFQTVILIIWNSSNPRHRPIASLNSVLFSPWRWTPVSAKADRCCPNNITKFCWSTCMATFHLFHYCADPVVLLLKRASWFWRNFDAISSKQPLWPNPMIPKYSFAPKGL